MAQKLVLPTKFLNSEHLPEVCLFSGRTDTVTERTMSFNYLSTTGQIICAVLFFCMWIAALVVYLVMRVPVTISVPQASGEKFKWSMKRQSGALAFVILPTLFCFLAIFLEGVNRSLVPVVLVAGAVISLAAVVGLGIWGTMTTMSIKVVDPETIELKFPDSQQGTLDAYKAAYATWRTERHGKRPSRAEKGEDDDWADEAEGSWDQGKKKA